MSHHQHHHGGGDPQPHDFFAMEDMLRRDFELKKDKLIQFLIRAGLKEGQQVLELGCGFAPLLELYCDTVGPAGGVTLVDPEPRLADRLAPRLAGRPNARFVASRAEDLATGEAARPVGGAGAGFDLAVMINVFHHLADPPAALAALRGTLRQDGGRLVIFDFVHDTLRLFVSGGASAAARTVQARLADLVRPAASPVTARCADSLVAAGFRLSLRDCFVLQDSLGSPLGHFYSEVFLKHSLERLAARGGISEAEAKELLERDLPELNSGDPEAVLFSDIHVMMVGELAK